MYVSRIEKYFGHIKTTATKEINTKTKIVHNGWEFFHVWYWFFFKTIFNEWLNSSYFKHQHSKWYQQMKIKYSILLFNKIEKMAWL